VVALLKVALVNFTLNEYMMMMMMMMQLFIEKQGKSSTICLSLLFGLKIIQTVFLVLHTISSLKHHNSSSLISACDPEREFGICILT